VAGQAVARRAGERPDGAPACRRFHKRLLPADISNVTGTRIPSHVVRARFPDGLAAGGGPVPAAAPGAAAPRGNGSGMHGPVLQLPHSAHDHVDSERSVALGMLARLAPVGLFQLDLDGGCLFVNDTWCELMGLSADQASGSGWLAIVHPDDRQALREAWVRARAAGAEINHVVRIVRRDSTAIRWIRGHARPMQDAGGRTVGYVGSATDITEQRRAEDELQVRVRQDVLTDLPNRLHLREALTAGIDRARSDGGVMALLFMDLDAFKEINDTLGHEAGDRLLVQVARRIVATVRATDTVARLGGDEFAVVLPSTDHEEGAQVVAAKISHALEAPFFVAGQQVTVGASIGIALYPDHGAEDPDVLMRQADIAMYRAKRDHSTVAFFDGTTVDHHGPAGFSRLGELRRAIEDGELVLHYQPWLDTHTGAVEVAEALVRWQHPARGLLPPAEFLPLAEQSGLIRALDLSVIDAACAQARRWRDSDHLARMRLAVNVSRASLLDDDFPASVAAALIRHRLEGPELELEITENGVFGDPEQAAWLTERLQALNVRIAIDDFGTGYSSLAQLRRLRAATLKIDRSFVATASTNLGDLAIVETIIALGHRFGQAVVAEGVEDAATADLLTACGADYLQGFHICRPRPADLLEAWMHARGRGGKP